MDDGIHNVVNHALGKRFDDIVVGTTDYGTVSVSGNVIQWSDDDYYQVQRADTSNS